MVLAYPTSPTFQVDKMGPSLPGTDFACFEGTWDLQTSESRTGPSSGWHEQSHGRNWHRHRENSGKQTWLGTWKSRHLTSTAAWFISDLQEQLLSTIFSGTLQAVFQPMHWALMQWLCNFTHVDLENFTTKFKTPLSRMTCGEQYRAILFF